MTKYCPSCGVVNNQNDEICGRCGSRIVYDGTARPKKDFLVPITRPMSEYEWNTRPRFMVESDQSEKVNGSMVFGLIWPIVLFSVFLTLIFIF